MGNYSLYLQQTCSFLQCFVLQIHPLPKRLQNFIFSTLKNFGNLQAFCYSQLLFCITEEKYDVDLHTTLNYSSCLFLTEKLREKHKKCIHMQLYSVFSWKTKTKLKFLSESCCGTAFCLNLTKTCVTKVVCYQSMDFFFLTPSQWSQLLDEESNGQTRK